MANRTRSTSPDFKHDPPALEYQEGLSDQEVFQQAMSEVTPLPRTGGFSRARETRLGNGKSRPELIGLEDLLAEFLAREAVPYYYPPEYLEGGPQQSNPLLLR